MMERELAVFSLDDEEDEIVEVQRQVESTVNENEFYLVINGVPWTFNNHLLVFHRLVMGEDPLKAMMALGIEVTEIVWDLTL
ncbi:hypothetical protein Gogos_015231 [Gossypium gossypioides]|uniref:Uncharacterized protein n=1 Tax=Gossypium gossypioides TaxID=34282 RepID=A0A7J9C110_GOSGO|nr:hypothetical protein [Gossypium gossypioides]